MINYTLYIAIALLPSALWLLWYLRKDKHPEPRAMIIKVFIWGMLLAFPAILAENAFNWATGFIQMPNLLRLFVVFFLGVAAIEEALKFSVVRFKVLNTTEIDEPADAMFYMIISALGFAAIENIIILTPLFAHSFAPTIAITFSRFVGATFLHVLASGIWGYYIALSLFKPSKKFPLLIHGFLLAVLLHGFYNILVVNAEKYPYFILPLAVIIILSAIMIATLLKKLSTLKSITEIK